MRALFAGLDQGIHPSFEESILSLHLHIPRQRSLRSRERRVDGVVEDDGVWVRQVAVNSFRYGDEGDVLRAEDLEHPSILCLGRWMKLRTGLSFSSGRMSRLSVLSCKLLILT
jgi:hypothetical protein